MRKVFTIIIIILLIIAVLLTGAWLFSRKKAVNNGQQAPTFRQFFGLGSGKTSSNGSGNGTTGLSSDFTNGDNTGANGGSSSPVSGAANGGSGVPVTGGNVAVSQFTSSTLTPSQGVIGEGQGSNGNILVNGNSIITNGSGVNGNGVVGAGNVTGGGNATGSGTGTPDNPTPPPLSPDNGFGPGGNSACSDADTNIVFTPEEITRLTALQNRFYAVAQSLHTDGDVATELANHDAFKAKADLALDLYNYCVAKAPLIGSPILQARIGTPFWFNQLSDKQGYITDKAREDVVNPSDSERTKASLEHVFRLNLW